MSYDAPFHKKRKATMTWADTHIDHDEAERINALFFGKSVEKVADDQIVLSDGTRLKVVANEGCGGCSAGWYELKALNGCENVITRAEVVDQPADGDDRYNTEFVYTLFVYADNQKVNLATVEGDDGNGYYGTGFSLVVVPEDRD